MASMSLIVGTPNAVLWIILLLMAAGVVFVGWLIGTAVKYQRESRARDEQARVSRTEVPDTRQP